MKPLLRMGTLGSRIYSFFILFIFGTIIILQIVAFQFTISTVRNTTIESNKTLLGQLTSQIDSYIEDMDHLSLAVIEAEEVQTYLRGEAPAPLTDYVRMIQKQLGTYLKAREDIKNIYFSDMSGNILSADRSVTINQYADVRKNSWFTQAVENPSETVLSGSYVQNLIFEDYSWVVSLSRGIVSEDTGELLGVLLIDLKFDGIKDLCQSMVTGRKGYNFIIDDEGVYVFHPTQQLVYSGVKSEPLDEILAAVGSEDAIHYSDGEKYYFINDSAQTGWHVISVLYDDDIITDWRYVQVSFAAIGLVLFLVVGLVTNRITRGITSPVKKLQEIMRCVDEGEFHLVGEIMATDEIKELAHDYDIMVTRIRELMHENITEQELKRKSDLKALQAQINPHFLYNTLDSIIWMAEMKQHREVVLMTSALSKLMRISISKGRELIPIRDEIAHVESYLTIEEMRYCDKYDSVIDIDPILYDELTLKITLQPLVENAIYHGIKESDHKGLIRIIGWLEGDTIILQVIDNGKGMSPDKVELLNSPYVVPEDDQPWANLRGMGVRNVHERIQLYFGHEYGLHCESEPGKGTTITIRIPSRKGVS